MYSYYQWPFITHHTNWQPDWIYCNFSETNAAKYSLVHHDNQSLWLNLTQHWRWRMAHGCRQVAMPDSVAISLDICSYIFGLGKSHSKTRGGRFAASLHLTEPWKRRDHETEIWYSMREKIWRGWLLSSSCVLLSENCQRILQRMGTLSGPRVEVEFCRCYHWIRWVDYKRWYQRMSSIITCLIFQQCSVWCSVWYQGCGGTILKFFLENEGSVVCIEERWWNSNDPNLFLRHSWWFLLS